MSRQQKELDIPKSKKNRVQTKPGSWLTNATKSLGYSSMDILTEILPNTLNMSKSALESSQEFIREMKDIKTVKGRLSQSMDNNVYLDLLKEWKNNSLDDLKSGNFYNKERQDSAFDDGFDGFDVGDDSDFNVDFSSDDGETSVSMSRSSNAKQESDNIVVTTNINNDNPMVDAVKNQTKLTVQANNTVMELSKRNQLLTMQYIQHLGENTSSLLNTMNANLMTISKDGMEMVAKHIGVTAQYYDESIRLFTEIHKELQSMNTATKVADANNPNVKHKEYNDVLDIFSGGGVNVKDYMKLVKSQWDSTSDSNLYLSSFKNIASQTDVLSMMAKNPLKFVSDGLIKKMIPSMVKDAASQFDNSLGEVLVSKLFQVGNMSNSSNPILELVGKIFGINNKMKSSPDKSQYEKGAVAWNGISHRTLNDVIPFYLRKICSTISGKPEIGFDYDKGEYRAVNDISKDYKSTLESRMVSPLSNMAGDFKDYLDRMSFTDSSYKDTLLEQFQKLSVGLVKSDGGKNFRKIQRKDGTTRDDIADLLNLSSSDSAVELMRGFFEGSKHSDVMKFFNSDVLSAKAGYNKLVQDMEKDPVRYNTQYADLGVGKHDEFIKYDKAGTKVVSTSDAVGGQDKYEKGSLYYLRTILTTLNRGLKVAVVNASDMIHNLGPSPILAGGPATAPSVMYSNIVDGSASMLNKLKEQTTDVKHREDTNKKSIVGKTLTPQQIQKAQNQGKLVVDSYNGVNTQSARAVREQMIAEENSKPNETALSKAGILMPDSSLNKLAFKFSEYLDKPGQVMKDFFKKADDFAFKIVFGDDKSTSDRSLIAKSFDFMKNSFSNFSVWLDDKIIIPLQDSLFGENGIMTNLKNSQFIQDMKSKMSTARDYLFGTKAEGEEYRSGGMFSQVGNQLKFNMGLIKQALVGGKVKDPTTGEYIDQTSPSILDHVKDTAKKIGTSLSETFGIQSDPSKPSSGNALIDGLDNIWSSVKDRTSAFLDDVIGPRTDNPNDRRNRMAKLNEEVKAGMPKSMAYGIIGGGSAIGFGLLGSWFLPGGPIGGALLGTSIGIISSSESLKSMLFGDLEDDGEGGKRRAGAIISKDTQKFFKDHGKGVLLGAGAGAMVGGKLGLMGSIFSPLGPIGGALIGSSIAMLNKSDAFQEFLWGSDELDENGNFIKRGILGSLKDKAKDVKWSDKFLDAGIGSGVGLIGSFFLPGGPMMGALLGSVAGLTLNSERVKNLLFGEMDEETHKRGGGVLGTAKVWFTDNIGNPMKKTIEQTQITVAHFVKSNMLEPMLSALDPVKHEFFKLQERISTGFHNVMTSFKDNANKTFEKYFGKPLGEFMTENVFTPLKNTLGKIFGGIGTVIGAVASAPFKLLNHVSDNLFTKHQKEGRQAFVKDGVEAIFKPSARKEQGISFGSAVGRMLKPSNYRDAKNSEQGASYNKDGVWEKARAERRAKYDQERQDALDKLEAKYGTSEDKKQNKKRDKKKKDNKVKPIAKSDTKVSATTPDTKTSLTKEDEKSNKQNQTTTEVPTTHVTTDVETQPKQSKVVSMSDKFKNLKEYYTRPTSKANITHSTGVRSASKNQSKTTQKIGSGTFDTTTKVANDQNRADNVSFVDKKIEKASVKSSKLSQGQRDTLLKSIEAHTKTISAEVRGQLDGLGSNTFKIRKMVQKKLGVSDEDMTGESNRDRVGFFGKLKRGLRHPMDFIGGLISKPIIGLINGVHTVLENGKKLILAPFELMHKAITYTGKGILALGKGIGGLAKDLLKIPALLAGTLYEAVKTVGPIIAEAGVQAMKVAGTFMVTAIQTTGKVLFDTVSSIGGFMKASIVGAGEVLGSALIATAHVITVGATLAKDAIISGGKLLIQGVNMVAQTALSILSAPFKMVGHLFSGHRDRKDNRFRNKIQNVKVIGGKLDVIETIKHVILPNTTKETPIFKQQDTTDDSDGKIGTTRVSTTTDNVNSALQIHSQEEEEKANKKEHDVERKANAKDYKYFKTLDSTQDKELLEQKQKGRFMDKLSELTEATKKHASQWGSIFSKKGLITSAIVLGIPLVISAIKKIKEALSNFGGSLNPVEMIKNIENQDASGRHDPDYDGQQIENQFYNKAKTKAVIDTARLGVKAGKSLYSNADKLSKPIASTISGIKDNKYMMSVAKDEFDDILKVKDDLITSGVGKKEARKQAIALSRDTAPTITKATSDASTSIADKILKHFQQGVDIFLNNGVVKKIMGSDAIKQVSSMVKGLLPKMKQTIIENFPKLSGKMARLASDATWAFPPLGLVLDVVFGVSDAITGWNDACKIFRVSKHDVTLGMRLIGTITKVLIGWNGIIDFANEVIRIMSDGVGFREILAESMYNAACKCGVIFGMSSESNDLKQKQDSFKQDYTNYNARLKAQNKDQLSFSGYQDKMSEGILTKSKKWISDKAGKVKDWTVNKAIKAKDWTVNKAGKVKDWTVNKAGKVKDWTVNKAGKVKDWTVNKAKATGSWISDKAVKAKDWTVNKAVKAKDWTVNKAKATGSWISDKAVKAKNLGVSVAHKMTGDMFNDNGIRATLGLYGDQEIGMKDRTATVGGNLVHALTFGKLDKSESAKAIYELQERFIEKTKEGWKNVAKWSSDKWDSQKKKWDTSVTELNNSFSLACGFVDDKGKPLPFGKAFKDVTIKKFDDIKSNILSTRDKTLEGFSKLKEDVHNSWDNQKKKWATSVDNFNKNLSLACGFVDDKGDPLPFGKSLKEAMTNKLSSIKGSIVATRDKTLEGFSKLKEDVRKTWEVQKNNWATGVSNFNKSLGLYLGFVDDDGQPLSFTSKMSDIKSKTLTGISNKVISIRSDASELWDKVKKGFKTGTDWMMDSIKKLPHAFDTMLGGLFGLADENGKKLGLFEWIGQKTTSSIKNTASGVSNWWKDLNTSGDDKIDQRNRSLSGKGGFGGTDDFAYYSQNDPKYADAAYNTSAGHTNGGVPETIGKRGCGPTSLAMVTSQLTGRKIDPTTMAGIATSQGYSTNLGTSPDYFKNVGKQFGLSVNESSTSEGAVRSSLASGQPVILQGVSTDKSSPFTSAGHYVVATKTDDNKIMIKDPRGKQYSKAYNIDQVVGDSARMWSFGTSGMGTETSSSRNVGQSMVDIATQYVGRPYIWGGEGPIDWDGNGATEQGFDCSGLVGFALNQSGVTNYGRSSAQMFYDKCTKISKSDLSVGDLGFCKNPMGAITHVGIYAGNDEWVEAMGSPTSKVVRVPSNRASKWTDYGRLKEVSNSAGTSVSADQSAMVKKKAKPTDIFSGVANVVKGNFSRLFGIDPDAEEEDEVGMSLGGYNSNTKAGSLREAINQKTIELLIKNEGGGDYAIAQNDKNSGSGQSISPSIGILQWRAEYADELMKRMHKALPNDSDAKYFDDMNWKAQDNAGPWSSSQLSRFRNYMIRNGTISKRVQDEYAKSYIDDRLTTNLYKNAIDPGKIKDPRSMVMLNEISQTGPGQLIKFMKKYNKKVPSGKSEFDHFYSQITDRNTNYWGARPKYYSRRLKNDYESLANWKVDVPGYTQGGFGEVSTSSCNPRRVEKPIPKAKRVDKDFNNESKAVQVSRLVQGFGSSPTDNKIVELLTTAISYLKGTKDGIDKFNNKDFTSNQTVNYTDTTNNNLATNTNNNTNNHSSSKRAQPKNTNTKTSDVAYRLAQSIASGINI